MKTQIEQGYSVELDPTTGKRKYLIRLEKFAEVEDPTDLKPLTIDDYYFAEGVIKDTKEQIDEVESVAIGLPEDLRKIKEKLKGVDFRTPEFFDLEGLSESRQIRFYNKLKEAWDKDKLVNNIVITLDENMRFVSYRTLAPAKIKKQTEQAKVKRKKSYEGFLNFGVF